MQGDNTDLQAEIERLRDENTRLREQEAKVLLFYQEAYRALMLARESINKEKEVEALIAAFWKSNPELKQVADDGTPIRVLALPHEDAAVYVKARVGHSATWNTVRGDAWAVATKLQYWRGWREEITLDALDWLNREGDRSADPTNSGKPISPNMIAAKLRIALAQRIQSYVDSTAAGEADPERHLRHIHTWLRHFYSEEETQNSVREAVARALNGQKPFDDVNEAGDDFPISAEQVREKLRHKRDPERKQRDKKT
jgi:hypothetical protein